MRCFAISDLHLSFVSEKPMDRFGPHWERHWEKVERSWRERITPDDLVLVPGDHSWALKLDEARQDLEWISQLPGHKVLVRGNHDYWWQSLGKVRKAFPGLTFLQNDAARFGDAALCGTRGWDLPGKNGFETEEDEKIYRREVERFKLALNSLDKTAPYRIALLHYPPLFPFRRESEFTQLMETHRIDICVYGHMHQGGGVKAFQGEQNGVHYYLVSCDMIGFEPIEIPWPERSVA